MQAGVARVDTPPKRRSPRHHSASGAAPSSPPATLELQTEEWRGLGIVGLRAEHFVKVRALPG